MKITKTYLLYAFVLITVPHAFSATEGKEKQSADYKLPVYNVEEITTLPKPIHYPKFPVPKGLGGTTIKLKFTVDVTGRPRAVRLVQPKGFFPDDTIRDFAVGMRIMVSNWKFTPALDAYNQPISVKVIMPIKVVDKDNKSVALVSLSLDNNEDDPS